MPLPLGGGDLLTSRFPCRDNPATSMTEEILVGYQIWERDIDAQMWDKYAGLKLCPKCGYRLDFQAYNPEFTLRRSEPDLGVTWDGGLVASARFREFCQQHA